MIDILLTETALTSRLGRLPDTYSFSKRGFAFEDQDLTRLLFGASEYIKDGLLPITEFLGQTPWRVRLLGILDDIWRHAAVETRRGRIPSDNPEVNGNMLQALSRAYWMTGQASYLELATRPDVFFGAVREGRALHINLRAGPAWAGVLRFDPPRHRTNMGMPMDWPRMNQFPEWFTVEADRRYDVRDISNGTRSVRTGAELQRGVPLALAADRETRLVVNPIDE